MNNLKESECLLLELAHMCCGAMPKTYSENNGQLWQAFRIGRFYEAELAKEKAS